jgi:hypothetical protein
MLSASSWQRTWTGWTPGTGEDMFAALTYLVQYSRGGEAAPGIQEVGVARPSPGPAAIRPAATCRLSAAAVEPAKQATLVGYIQEAQLQQPEQDVEPSGADCHLATVHRLRLEHNLQQAHLTLCVTAVGGLRWFPFSP